MSTFKKHVAAAVMAMFALFIVAIREVRAGVLETPKSGVCRQLPVIKNLTGLKGQHICNPMVAAELTRGEVKKLAATAKYPEDHLTIARFYRAQANGLDAQAAGYESASANLRNGPVVKNFTSFTTAGRLAFAAKGLREEARADRALGASHEEMAKTVVASLD